MRRALAIVATLALAQCASGGRDDAAPQAAAQGTVYLGIAKAASSTTPTYTMLWRRIDPATGAFMPPGDGAVFETRTDDGGSIRIRGIPGEFESRRLPPGQYGLDSVFALVPGDHVNYVAQGVVVGPDRPVFQVEAGETVFLGIWQVSLTPTSAVTRLWRLDQNDAHAVASRAHAPDLAIRETTARAVPCSPHRMSNLSQRQIC